MRRVLFVKMGDKLIVTDKQVKGGRVLASAKGTAVSIEVGGSRFNLSLVKKKPEPKGGSDATPS